MWSVGISVSPSAEAERLGYDERQINRIVIRMAQYFLDRDKRIIFGHDWREDGVMRAVADFASVVAGRAEELVESKKDLHGLKETTDVSVARMVNVVPASRDELSRVALKAERDSGGALRVMAAGDLASEVWEHWGSEMKARGWVTTGGRGGRVDPAQALFDCDAVPRLPRVSGRSHKGLPGQGTRRYRRGAAGSDVPEASLPDGRIWGRDPVVRGGARAWRRAVLERKKWVERGREARAVRDYGCGVGAWSDLAWYRGPETE